jgi:hypothetical protein
VLGALGLLDLLSTGPSSASIIAGSGTVTDEVAVAGDAVTQGLFVFLRSQVSSDHITYLKNCKHNQQQRTPE